jgi:MerR family transcriptional regulator, aldehyde-responsive regulator
MKINEVSKLYDISADTLRYYERIGLVPPVTRNESGIRDYSETDCNWVQFAKCMRAAGISVESLIEYVALFGQGDATRAARKEILLEERAKLVERMQQMQATLDKLNNKIDNYYKCVEYEDMKLK